MRGRGHAGRRKRADGKMRRRRRRGDGGGADIGHHDTEVGGTDHITRKLRRKEKGEGGDKKIYGRAEV